MGGFLGVMASDEENRRMSERQTRMGFWLVCVCVLTTLFFWLGSLALALDLLLAF